MTVKRYMKKCEEFAICSETGSAGDVYVDRALENRALYHILIKGSGRGGFTFDSEYVEADSKDNNFHYKGEYIGSDLIFQAYEDYHIFGFCPLDLKHNWNGRLVKESFDGEDGSWLICFDGRPIVNGKELQRMDYARLENKKYEVELNDSVIGLFKRVQIL